MNMFVTLSSSRVRDRWMAGSMEVPCRTNGSFALSLRDARATSANGSFPAVGKCFVFCLSFHPAQMLERSMRVKYSVGSSIERVGQRDHFWDLPSSPSPPTILKPNPFWPRRRTTRRSLRCRCNDRRGQLSRLSAHTIACLLDRHDVVACDGRSWAESAWLT